MLISQLCAPNGFTQGFFSFFFGLNLVGGSMARS